MASYCYHNPYRLSLFSIIKWPQCDAVQQIFNVCVCINKWLQGHGGRSEVVLDCAINIYRPFQTPYIDIRQRWLNSDTPMQIACHVLVYLDCSLIPQNKVLMFVSMSICDFKDMVAMQMWFSNVQEASLDHSKYHILISNKDGFLLLPQSISPIIV